MTPPSDRWIACPHCAYTIHVSLSRFYDDDTGEFLDPATVWCPRCAEPVDMDDAEDVAEHGPSHG